MKWLLNLLFGLTKAERACCHMSAAQGLTCRSLRQWRTEFADIDRSEHCDDCPALPSPPRDTRPDWKQDKDETSLLPREASK